MSIDSSPRERCRAWVERVVMGLELCPFAEAVVQRNQLRFAVCETAEFEAMLRFLIEEIAWLEMPDGPRTTLVVLPDGLADFGRFLDLVAAAEDLIHKIGKSGAFQLAHFHPEYVFEGTLPDDPGNLTNRSPVPILHVLRCEDVALAIESHPDPSGIPVRNVEVMRSLGTEGLRRLLEQNHGERG